MTAHSAAERPSRDDNATVSPVVYLSGNRQVSDKEGAFFMRTGDHARRAATGAAMAAGTGPARLGADRLPRRQR
jgi:hypothetical protein